jgi:hypothetical protein
MLQEEPPRGGEVVGGAVWRARGRLEPALVEAMCCHARHDWDRREREGERREERGEKRGSRVFSSLVNDGVERG